MSRNPYLAASRPVSSFTRSSRTSKRNDLSSSKGSLLGRSRSSTALGGSLSPFSSYGTSSYTSATSTWQRPSSSTRLTRYERDQTITNTSSNDVAFERPLRVQSSTNDDDCTNERTTESREKSISSQALSCPDDNSGGSDIPEVKEDSHLKNYQQSKIDHPEPRRTRSSIQSLESQDDSLETRQSTTSLDSSRTEPPYQSESISIASSSVPKHLRQGLGKSHSLEITQQTVDKASMLGSMSVDRLLSRSESMSERDLRKLFKELAMENERLRLELKSIDDREKQRQQEWIRKERQMQRKISELEEESKQAEQCREEIQRLKDENRSLIRVVTKLSKKN